MVEKARDVPVVVWINVNVGSAVQLEQVEGIVLWTIFHSLLIAKFANKIRNVCSYVDGCFDYLNCKKEKTGFNALS